MRAIRLTLALITVLSGCTTVSVTRGDLVVKVVDFHPAGSKTDFKIEKTGDDYTIDTIRNTPSSDKVVKAAAAGLVEGVLL